MFSTGIFVTNMYIMKYFLFTLIFLQISFVNAQDHSEIKDSLQRSWFMGSDLTSQLRPNAGYNLQTGFRKGDKIYTFGFDMYTRISYAISQEYNGGTGNHFQLAFNKKYLRKKKENRFFQKYNGYEITYSRAKFEEYIRVYEENGIWHRSYSGRREGTVPGVVFLQHRIKVGYIAGSRHDFKSGIYLDASVFTGISFYHNQEVSYPLKFVQEPSYHGPSIFPAGYFDGIHAIGNQVEKLLTHSLFEINESGIALAFQVRFTVGYSF